MSESNPTPAAPTAAAPADFVPASAEPVDAAVLRERVVEQIMSCYDPEVPVNIWELGLIYGLDVTDAGVVDIKMTLTSPACPVAGSLPPEVEMKVKTVKGVRDVKLELVWDPPWDMSRMSEAARLQLNMMY